MSSVDRWKSQTLLLVAAAIVAALMFVPYGYLLVYPFRLFGTFIHEVGHAVAAVATGGYVESMVVNFDTSGYVKSGGGVRVIVASAGYLASVAVGAALLFAGRRRQWARNTLIVTGVATIGATAVFAGYGGATASLFAFLILAAGIALFVIGNRRSTNAKGRRVYAILGTAALAGAAVFMWLIGGLLTAVIGLVMGAAILMVAFYASRLIQHLTVLFLGVQISLDGLNSIQVLWNITSQGHGHNDAATMAELTGLPAGFWAVSWGLMGLAVIGAAFWSFWRSDE